MKNMHSATYPYPGALIFVVSKCTTAFVYFITRLWAAVEVSFLKIERT